MVIKKPRKIYFSWGKCENGYSIVKSNGELWFEPNSSKVIEVFPLVEDTSLFHNLSELNPNSPECIHAFIQGTGLGTGYGMERESVLDWEDYIRQMSRMIEKWDGRKIDNLVHDFNGLIIGGIHKINLGMDLEKDLKTGKYKREAIPLLYLQPKTLFEAIWIQFAQAVEDSIPQYECNNCNKWFVPKNENSQFCNINCKMNKHDHNISNKKSSSY